MQLLGYSVGVVARVPGWLLSVFAMELLGTRGWLLVPEVGCQGVAMRFAMVPGVVC